jgi:hypothetical protein
MSHHEFIATLDFGVLGEQPVSIDYTHDHGHNKVVSVWLLDGRDVTLEITDWLTPDAENEVERLIETNWPFARAERMAEIADSERDLRMDAILEMLP